MLNLIATAKVVGSLAAVAAALVAAATGAQANFHSGRASLTAHTSGCTASGTDCTNLFAGGGPLYPGSAPLMRDVEVAYTGPGQSSTAGLYIRTLSAAAGHGSASCTASDPASVLNLVVTSSGTVLYRGSLADFTAHHGDPTTLLVLSGGHLAPGSTTTVTLSITMDRAADNSYMGCAIDTDFAWYAAA